MRGGDGLFEVEPVEKQQPQGHPAGVDKRLGPFDLHQVLLLPPSLDDWLPQEHLARFVADLVDEVLDLGPVLTDYADKRGYPPYYPRLMLRLLIYGYPTGVRSSRFRRHLEALAGLFTQSLHLAQRLGMVKMGRVALGGTKLEANASNHKAMSYGRLVDKEEPIVGRESGPHVLAGFLPAVKGDGQRAGPLHVPPHFPMASARTSRTPRASVFSSTHTSVTGITVPSCALRLHADRFGDVLGQARAGQAGLLQLRPVSPPTPHRRPRRRGKAAMSGTHTVRPPPYGLSEAELPLNRDPYEALVTAVLAWKDSERRTPRPRADRPPADGHPARWPPTFGATPPPCRRLRAAVPAPEVVPEVVLREANGRLCTPLEGTARCTQNRARLVRDLYARLDRLT